MIIDHGNLRVNADLGSSLPLKKTQMPSVDKKETGYKPRLKLTHGNNASEPPKVYVFLG